ncbi:MAG: FKBP-type peptidyl-prolyl cis-trans isomerase [Sphingomonas bacterium]|nr:FKBP-type peptidyl-prolyl cis-trans isomerase [Sphingomonas bacterium]
MSVTQVPLRPIARGSQLKYWLAIAALVIAAFLLARLGAGQFKALEVDVVAPGSGGLLTDVDGVMLEYTGKTEDGTVFDSTDGRGPAPMLVGQVVPGFRQALLQMQEGGRYKVLIPGRLAYGPNPPPQSGLKPNADLYFDVHVVQVVRNAAILAAQQQQQMQQMQQMQQQQGAPPPAPAGR